MALRFDTEYELGEPEPRTNMCKNHAPRNPRAQAADEEEDDDDDDLDGDHESFDDDGEDSPTGYDDQSPGGFEP